MCKLHDYSNKHLSSAEKRGMVGGGGGGGGAGGGGGGGGGGGVVARYLILAALSMLQTIPPFSFLVGFFVFGWGVNIKYKSY